MDCISAHQITKLGWNPHVKPIVQMPLMHLSMPFSIKIFTWTCSVFLDNSRQKHFAVPFFVAFSLERVRIPESPYVMKDFKTYSIIIHCWCIDSSGIFCNLHQTHLRELAVSTIIIILYFVLAIIIYYLQISNSRIKRTSK